MAAAKHSSQKSLLALLLLTGAIALAVLPAPGAAIKVSNMSSFPDTIHSGDLANFTLDIAYTTITSSNVSYHFSSGFQNPAWNYWVWVDDHLVQTGRVMGDSAYSLPPGLSLETNDRVRLHIEVTETAPPVLTETEIRAIDVMEIDETGYAGAQTFTIAMVYPAS